MKSPIFQWLLSWAVLAFGVVLATKLVRGIEYRDGVALAEAALCLGLLNAGLRPLLLLFTLPFIVLTLGLGVVVINAMLFLLVGKIVTGFYVAGFWPAVWGACVVSVTNMVVSSFVRGKARAAAAARPTVKKKPDDVIDI